MTTLQFTVDINAPASKVWNVLWDDVTYRKWTTAFCEGSYAVSNWNEGDSVHFLDPNGNGMYSVIEKKIDNELMSFRHIGNIMDLKEMPLDEETKLWSNSKEIYELKEANNQTKLTVKVDTLENYVGFFNDHMPKAIELVKNLSEN
ncbi:SRPBCC family protein [Flavobacterium terrigena]|uniref:Activator of Hsp90 ATPase homolog 1-like protein n=1 Tax=Flavobacterium terrigena TaxID=402734 RepID=A0A1H6U985_9FLAO|nr:ATPase [Flavobacterium terrigena]SEI88106.1 hypothetical protein SAMN05660918_1799 [Flavobacterium terrigena]